MISRKTLMLLAVVMHLYTGQHRGLSCFLFNKKKSPLRLFKVARLDFLGEIPHKFEH